MVMRPSHDKRAFLFIGEMISSVHGEGWDAAADGFAGVRGGGTAGEFSECGARAWRHAVGDLASGARPRSVARGAAVRADGAAGDADGEGAALSQRRREGVRQYPCERF